MATTLGPWPPGAPDGINQVESMLGLECVSYCTASSKEDVAARFTCSKHLSKSAESSLKSLVDLTAEVVQYAAAQKTPTDFLWILLSVFNAENKMILANTLRTSAGGHVLLPKHEDQMVEKLQRIAVNVYPLFLIPPGSDFPLSGASISLTRALMSYPETFPLAVEILNDPDLCKLCPHSAVGGDDQAFLSFMAHSIIENIIGYSFNKLVLDSRRVPTVEELCEAIPDSLATARCMIQGKRVTLPSVAGLANILLPVGTVMEFGSGRISEYLSIYDRWSPGQLRDKRVTQNSDRGQHEFNRVGDVLLRVDQQVRLKITSQESGLQWTINPVDPTRVPTAQSVALLAATLGIENDPPVAAHLTWSVSFSPLASPLGQWNSIERFAMAPLCALSPEEVGAWADWISRINVVGFVGVEVAARRIQIAIAERDSPVDRFVDSIIAWENLFGGGGEMTLRISASLAWILGADANQRKDIYETARKLYQLRGKVVHGAARVDEVEVAKASISGLLIAVAALRKIYLELPYLVPSSAEKRSLSTVLQTPPPSTPGAANPCGLGWF
jgi:hypothetical protein